MANGAVGTLTGCYYGNTLCKRGRRRNASAATWPQRDCRDAAIVGRGGVPQECDVGVDAGMDGAHHMGRDEPTLESDLIDLTGVDLEQLSALPSSVLTVSLRRILAENSVASEQYAGFESFV